MASGRPLKKASNGTFVKILIANPEIRMKFDEAVAKAIKTYYGGKLPEKVLELQGGTTKYTPEYFDEVEKELTGEEPAKEEVVEDVN